MIGYYFDNQLPFHTDRQREWKVFTLQFRYLSRYTGYLAHPFLNKQCSTRKQPYTLQANWPLVAACHAGMLADNRTPVGSVYIIYKYSIFIFIIHLFSMNSDSYFPQPYEHVFSTFSFLH